MLIKKVLLSLIVVGALGTVTVHRVQAVYLSEVINTGSNVASGTFTFDTSIGAQAACGSGGFATANNNQNVCTGVTGTIFSALPLRYPGDQTAIAVKVKNTGSIDAQDLQVSMNNCASSTTPGVTLFGTEGTANACGTAGLELYIQETDLNGNDLTTGCLYPDPHAKPFSPADAPGTGSTKDCTNMWTANSLSDFQAKSCWDLGRLTALTTRYFKIGVQFPIDSANTFQGTTGTFDVTWHLDSLDSTYSPSACAND